MILIVLTLLANQGLDGLKPPQNKLQSRGLQSLGHIPQQAQSLMPPHSQDLVDHMRNPLLRRRLLTRILITADPIIQKIRPRRDIINRISPLPLAPHRHNLINTIPSLKLSNPLLIALLRDQEGVNRVEPLLNRQLPQNYLAVLLKKNLIVRQFCHVAYEDLLLRAFLELVDMNFALDQLLVVVVLHYFYIDLWE